MAIRKDEAQLLITIDAKESAEYQKMLLGTKDGIKDLKKLEQGTEDYNKKLNEVVASSKKLAAADFTKLNGKQIADRKKQLEDLRRILPQVTFAEAGFENELKSLNGALAENNKRTRAVVEATKSAQGGFGGFAGFLKTLTPTLIAFFAIDRIKEWFSSIINGAVQLDGVKVRFETVFGEAAGLVQGYAETTGIALGLSEQQFRKVAAATGDLLVPLRFSRTEAATMSNEVIKLSAALAAWEGGTRSTEEVSQILNKAILGEREQLKELGVAIQEADVKQRLAAKGQDKYTGDALKQAKALATLELITESSADATTAYAQRQDSAGQVLARTNAKLQTAKDKFIEAIAPAVQLGLVLAEKVAVGAIAVVNGVRAIPQFIRENDVAIKGLVTGLLIFNGQMILASANSLRLAAVEKGRAIVTGAVTLAQQALNYAMTANPIGLVIKAVGLLVAGFAILYNKSETVRAGIAGLGAVANEIFTIVKEAVGSFIDGFQQLKDGNFADAFKSFNEGLKKSNPISLAFTQGKRLAEAFKKGYNDKLTSEDGADGAAIVASANTLSSGASPSGGVTIDPSSPTAGKDKKLKSSLGSQLFEAYFKLYDPKVLRKFLENRLEEIRIAGEKELAFRDQLFAQGLYSEEEYNQEVLRQKAVNAQKELDLLNSLSQGQSEQARKLQIEIFKLQKELANSRANELTKESAAELSELEKKFLQKLITEEEYNRLAIEQQLSQLDTKLALLEAEGLAETEAYRKIKDDKLALQVEKEKQEIENVRRTEEMKRALQEEGISTAKDLFSTAAELLGQDEAARKKHASAIKAFEMSNVLVNSYSEIAGIFKSTAGWGPTGWILATIRAALVGARAIGAISKISSQKFAKGDLLSGDIFSGPSHDNGGVKFALGGNVHEAEGGEAIINKRSTSVFKPVLSAINSYKGWGKKFAAGDLLPNTSPTGIAGVSLSSTPGADPRVGNLTAAIESLVAALPAAMSNIKAHVVYSDITKAGDTVSEIQRLSTY